MVRSTYKVILSHSRFGKDNFFKFVWNAFNVLLKVAGIVWKVSLNRIPCLTNLAQRKIIIQADATCHGHKAGEETVTHCFFQCRFFSLVWMECMS